MARQGTGASPRAVGVKSSAFSADSFSWPCWILLAHGTKPEQRVPKRCCRCAHSRVRFARPRLSVAVELGIDVAGATASNKKIEALAHHGVQAVAPVMHLGRRSCVAHLAHRLAPLKNHPSYGNPSRRPEVLAVLGEPEPAKRSCAPLVPARLYRWHFRRSLLTRRSGRNPPMQVDWLTP